MSTIVSKQKAGEVVMKFNNHRICYDFLDTLFTHQGSALLDQGHSIDQEKTLIRLSHSVSYPGRKSLIKYVTNCIPRFIVCNYTKRMYTVTEKHKRFAEMLISRVIVRRQALL